MSFHNALVCSPTLNVEYLVTPWARVTLVPNHACVIYSSRWGQNSESGAKVSEICQNQTFLHWTSLSLHRVQVQWASKKKRSANSIKVFKDRHLRVNKVKKTIKKIRFRYANEALFNEICANLLVQKSAYWMKSVSKFLWHIRVKCFLSFLSLHNT